MTGELDQMSEKLSIYLDAWLGPWCDNREINTCFRLCELLSVILLSIPVFVRIRADRRGYLIIIMMR